MTTFLQWNCRGYYPNFEELVSIIYSKKPKIICLQEIQLCGRQFFQPTTYKPPIVSDNRGENDRGGSAILLHKSVPFKKISLSTHLHAVAVIAYLDSPITVCSVYLAPSCPYSEADLVALFQQLPPPVLVLGDFNLRHPVWGDTVSSPHADWLLGLLDTFNLYCLNTGMPTHESLKSGTSSCIDVSLCSLDVSDRFEWSRSPCLRGSDHYPIYIQTLRPSPQPPPLSAWRYNRADWSSFSQATYIDHLPARERYPSVADAYTYFADTVLSAAQAHIPQSSSTGRPTTPWWSPECTQVIREKRRLYKGYKRDRSSVNLILFKAAAARSRRVTRKARRQYFRNYVSKVTSSTSTSSVFKVLKKISRKHHPPPHIAHQYGPNASDILFAPGPVADVLGYAFSTHSSISRYSASFYNIHQSTSPPDFHVPHEEDPPYNHLFTWGEFQAALRACKDGAIGPDGISYQMIRHLHPSASAFLLCIYNRVWVENTFPPVWSTATVIPIPKPGKDPSQVENQRPISLTCHSCKIMEKMVASRLIPTLEGCQAFSPCQFGFRQHRSTLDPLLRLDHDIREAFSNDKMTLAVFFDLEKAYDSTWRTGVLWRIHSLGLRGNLPLFLQNLMANRTIQVRYDGILSRHFVLEEGIPQGSVLSVILFAIGINDITSVIPSTVKHSLYVDDLALYITGTKLPFLERQLQLAIDNITNWSDSHGFRFSPTKTKAMLFRRRKRNGLGDYVSSNLKLYDTPIQPETQIRFLGIIFDNRLTYLPHIRHLRSSCRRPLDLLKHLTSKSWGANRKTMLHLYTTLVRSKLDYGCAIYGQTSRSYLHLLDPIQNEGLRIATGAFKSSPKVSLEVESNTMPLSLRRELLTCFLYLRLQTPSPSVMAPVLRRTLQSPPYWPFAQIVTSIFRFLGIPLNAVMPYVHKSTFPLWLFPLPKICTAMARFPKSTCHPRSLLASFYSHTDHAECTPIYTDGSKTSDGVGAAAVFPDSTLSHSLPEHASIFTAELVAILLALARILASDSASPYVIFSDSLSALQALQVISTRSPIVLEVQRFLFLLHSRRKSVSFCWIPSHIGIPGNESADKEAVRAATCRRSCQELTPDALKRGFLPATDYYPYVRRGFLSCWQECWTKDPRGSKLRAIKPFIGEWPSSFRKNRSWEVVLTRLRIGHTNLTHGHLMSREIPMSCPFCSTFTPVSIHHVLIMCPKLHSLRNRLFPGLSTLSPDMRLHSLLHDKPLYQWQQILIFLRNANLLNKI